MFGQLFKSHEEEALAPVVADIDAGRMNKALGKAPAIQSKDKVKVELTTKLLEETLQGVSHLRSHLEVLLALVEKANNATSDERREVLAHEFQEECSQVNHYIADMKDLDFRLIDAKGRGIAFQVGDHRPIKISVPHMNLTAYADGLNLLRLTSVIRAGNDPEGVLREMEKAFEHLDHARETFEHSIEWLNTVA